MYLFVGESYLSLKDHRGFPIFNGSRLSIRSPSCSIPPSASSFQRRFSFNSRATLWLRLRVDFFFKSDHQSVQSLQILKLREWRIQREDDSLDGFRSESCLSCL
jgi:hypothetical protein